MSKLALLFSGLSTVAIVTIAGIAVHREVRAKKAGGKSGAGSLLGLPQRGAPDGRDHASLARLNGGRFTAAVQSFDRHLDATGCAAAWPHLIKAIKASRAVMAHQGDDTRAVDQDRKRTMPILREWHDRCQS